MTKHLSEFLKNTSIYGEDKSIPEGVDPTFLIFLSLKEISSRILDLEQKEPVKVFIDEISCVLVLGELGKYEIENTPENLLQIAIRLYGLSHSNRFLNAILGFWPA